MFLISRATYRRCVVKAVIQSNGSTDCIIAASREPEKQNNGEEEHGIIAMTWTESDA